MEQIETDEERAKNRLQSASRIFYALAVVKLLNLFAAMRPVGPELPAGLSREEMMAAAFAWYGANAAVCIILGRGLEKRKIWAKTSGMIYGALHIVSLIFFSWIGPMAVLNGVLGIIAVVSIAVASQLGAFEPVDSSEG